MRTARSLLPLLLLACGGDKDDDPVQGTTGDTGPAADTDTDTDADADADTDVDVDTDTDTDVTGPTNGFVRIVHVAPTLPPLSVFAPPNPTPLLSGMPPITASGWGTVPPGPVTMLLGPTGGKPGDEFATLTETIVAGGRYSLVLAGSDGAVDARMVEEDLVGIPVGEVRLMIWNVGEGLGPFDMIDTTTSTPVVSNVTYGAGPTVVLAPAGERPVGLDLDLDGVSDVDLFVPDVGDGVTVPLYFLVDDDELVMLGHAPLGAFSVERFPFPDLTGDTGTSTPTGDTGTTSATTGETGVTDTSSTDTGTSSTDTSSNDTSDTGL